MEFISALWMPIVLSAVGVWIASALGWMVVGHHKKDFGGLPNEEAFTSAIRGLSIPPGNYGFPHAEDCKAANKDPEFRRKWQEGPLGMVSIWNPQLSMGKNMFLTFIVYLVAGTLIAYLGWSALPHAGVEFMKVFQVLGTAGILSYTIAGIPSGIWFQAYPRAIAMNILDGIIFGLITGAIFAAMWPAGQ